MKKRVSALLLVLLLALSLTGCAATTAADNASMFFSVYGAQLSTLVSGGQSGAASTDSRKQLETPANFPCTAAGDYSFDGVENADYYVIYLYKNGSSAYDYVSDNITGDGTITGSIAELQYAYGDYEVTCVAYPDYTSETYRSSEPASTTMKVEGEVAEPSLTFFWDCFTQELQVIWLNSGDYSTTDYPQTMEINVGGVTDTLEMDSSTTAYTVAGAEVGQTYEVDVTITFDSNYVSNSSFELDLGSVTCDEQANFAPEGYSYNSGLYSYADFPIAGEHFDLAAGGEIGRWKITKSANAWMSNASETAEYLIYTATPTDTADGDAYTYSVLAANDDGSDVYTGGFGTMNSFTGTLHLYSDNTFKVELDAIYICTDLISNAEQWHNASTIEGRWYENGDGTVDLSYNLGSETDLGKGTR
ncbi:MAG: hypothetical protein ACI3VN_11170 [Candidatus Onthomonas sp.]